MTSKNQTESEADMPLRDEIKLVRYGEPGKILFDFRGDVYEAPEPTDYMPAIDTTGTNGEASRSWAVRELISGRAVLS